MPDRKDEKPFSTESDVAQPDPADTIDMENEAIMETAEFRQLVALDAELFGDDDPRADEDDDDPSSA